jgi:hypothetical protein
MTDLQQQQQEANNSRNFKRNLSQKEEKKSPEDDIRIFLSKEFHTTHNVIDNWID